LDYKIDIELSFDCRFGNPALPKILLKILSARVVVAVAKKSKVSKLKLAEVCNLVLLLSL
jgi:hypothetical protein